jgi:ribosomal protein S18 acetylase RimI-like enzyme
LYHHNKEQLELPSEQRLTMDTPINAASRTSCHNIITCRDVQESDLEALLNVADASGLFTPEDLDSLLGDTLRGIFNGTLGKEHRARVITIAEVAIEEQDNSIQTEPIVAGWTFFAPSDEDEWGKGVYELYWIGVSPDCQRNGIGSRLLADCEALVQEAGASKLVICTSSTPATSKARAFYYAKGYLDTGTVVSDYYGPGDDKVTFVKSFAPE